MSSPSWRQRPFRSFFERSPSQGEACSGMVFSQNPPIHDLTVHHIDELWFIQINPSTIARVPTETHQILDRRNSLAGNLSMEQELRFIETCNRAIAGGLIKDSARRPIRITRIALDRALHSRTKADRNPELLGDLRAYGHAKSQWFLKERRNLRSADGENVGSVSDRGGRTLRPILFVAT